MFDLFKRAGIQLMPVLNEGGDRLRELGQRLSDLGLIHSKEALEGMARLMTRWTS